MNKQCASRPSIKCSCWRTWVCNHSNLWEWEKTWPEYIDLDEPVLKKLKAVVEKQFDKDHKYKNELLFLNYLIRTNANK